MKALFKFVRDMKSPIRKVSNIFLVIFTLLAVVWPDSTVQAALGNVPLASGAGVRLFGTTGNGGGTSTLVELDPTTGALLSTIGDVGYLVNGLTYDPVSDTLFASTSNNDVTFPKGLLTIDMTTGVGTEIGASSGIANLSTLASDSTGALFAWDGYYYNLVSIETATGAATAMGSGG